MAYMSSLPGPVQPASQIHARRKLHSHQTQAWGLATPTVAGNGGVETGDSSPTGICSHLHRAPWKMKCFAFRPVRLHMNVCTGGGRRAQGCVGALWCTKMLSKFWHFSLRDKALGGIYLKPFSFSETLFFLDLLLKDSKAFWKFQTESPDKGSDENADASWTVKNILIFKTEEKQGAFLVALEL